MKEGAVLAGAWLSRMNSCCYLTVSSPQTIQRGPDMVIGLAHLQPIVALIAGIAILLVPRLLNFIVAAYLIFIGVVGLGLIR
jgi:hypothetical protein